MPRSDNSELPLALNQVRELGRLRVVDLDELRAQRLQSLQCLEGLELGLLAGRDLLGGGNDDHVPVAPHVEALRRHDDVERLIPRDVLQPQRHAALDGIADDDVETAEVGDELQNRTRLEILEVQREAVAGVLAILIEQPGRGRGLLDGRLELESELVVGLVRDLVVLGGSRHDEPRVAIGAQARRP